MREKNITTGFVSRGLFLGAAVGFLFSIGFVSKETIIGPIAIFFIYMLHLNNIDKRKFKDDYMDFIKHVKEDKIENYKIKKLDFFGSYICYKRKY